MSTNSEPAPGRRAVYGILITVAVAAVAAHILAVQRVYEPALFRADPANKTDPRSVWPPARPEPEPTHGDNDRSRWDTVRALVDNGTYAIGQRITDPSAPAGYRDTGIIAEDGWKTIDKVLRPATGNEPAVFYSSKPPIVASLAAAEYWLLKRAFGLSIVNDRWVVVRVILLTFNWLPFLIYLFVLARLVERYGSTDWGRFFVLAAAGFGTYVFAFAITLNNHVLAAYCVLLALADLLALWAAYSAGGSSGLRASLFVVPGFFAALAACFELPATSFATAVLVVLFWMAPLRTLVLAAPAALVPVGFSLVTNYIAIGQVAPAYSEFGGPWYQYAGSHWLSPTSGRATQGIDFASEPKAVYAFHLLLGHHGFFSLTPVFLLAALGMVIGLVVRPRGQGSAPCPGFPVRDTGLLGTMLLTLLLTLVVVGFYVLKTNNYGGWTSGPRWLIWLTPLWLVSLLPAADWLSLRRWGRGLAYTCLAVSVLSVNYPPWNPWRHPWLYDLMEWLGWKVY